MQHLKIIEEKLLHLNAGTDLGRQEKMIASMVVSCLRMSPALKERLKRLNKQRFSPILKTETRKGLNIENKPCEKSLTSVGKSQCLSPADKLKMNSRNNQKSDNLAIPSNPVTEECLNICDLKSLQEILVAKKASLKERQDYLRRLELVEMYRTKNDPIVLENLISKWREVSQRALRDLQSRMPDPQPSLSQIIKHLNIDPDILSYSEDCEDFIT